MIKSASVIAVQARHVIILVITDYNNSVSVIHMPIIITTITPIIK